MHMRGINKIISEQSCLEWLAETCRTTPLNITTTEGWNHAKLPVFSGAGSKKVSEILAGEGS